MAEIGDAQSQAQKPAAAALQAKLNQGLPQSAAMGKFCSDNQTILMRCIYSELLLIKHGERRGELN
jgi:hypothetical protein